MADIEAYQTAQRAAATAEEEDALLKTALGTVCRPSGGLPVELSYNWKAAAVYF